MLVEPSISKLLQLAFLLIIVSLLLVPQHAFPTAESESIVGGDDPYQNIRRFDLFGEVINSAHYNNRILIMILDKLGLANRFVRNKSFAGSFYHLIDDSA
jgi:hypothetical protein